MASLDSHISSKHPYLLAKKLSPGIKSTYKYHTFLHSIQTMESVQIHPNPEPLSNVGPPAQFPPYYNPKFSNSPLHFSSEWDEAYEQARMSTVVTQTETPSKSRDRTAPVHFITPGKAAAAAGLGHLSGGPTASPMGRVMSAPKYSSAKADLAAPTPPPERQPAKRVHSMEVLWSMLNDITGKDKMAKFGQYTLRLLLHHSAKTQEYLSDDVVNIKLINKTYRETGRMMDLLVSFVQHPQEFTKIVVILTCSIFSLRFKAWVPALGTYRQLLRFGKSPFRLRALFKKLREATYHDPVTKSWKINDMFFNNNTLGEVISLYYSLNDEALLLYKLKFLRNPTLRKFVGKHESYAWYLDSWLALYNAWNNLNRLSQKEMDVKIQIQVKKKARAISKQLLGGTALHSLDFGNPDDDSGDSQALKEIHFRMTNARLDIYKTISDIVFNSYTVFNAALHFDTIQIWMGISASLLSSIKLYREKKRSLVKE